MNLSCRMLKIIYILFFFKKLGSANSHDQAGRIIYLQSGTTGLEIKYGLDDALENCSLLTNASPVNQSYFVTLPPSVVSVSEMFIASVTRSCEVFHHHLKDGVEPRRKRFIIYPGTKWCGIGNRAISGFDLGKYAFTDACCRAHDTCPIKISSFQSFMGLTNNGLFPSLSCDCEADFYNCLKRSPETAATEIGGIYFNLLRPKCVAFAHLSVCLERSKPDGSCMYLHLQPDLPRVPTFIRNPFVF